MKGSVHVIKECMGRVSFLYRQSHMLDLFCRKTLCSALVMPYMEYCCSSWYSGISSVFRSKPDIIQRKMVRYIFSMHPRDHVGTEHLLKLSWLRVSDRVRYFKLCHVFSIRNGLAPGYLSLNFVPVSTRHNHHTRGSQMNYAISKRFSNAPLVLLSRPLLNEMLCQLI